MGKRTCADAQTLRGAHESSSTLIFIFSTSSSHRVLTMDEQANSTQSDAGVWEKINQKLEQERDELGSYNNSTLNGVLTFVRNDCFFLSWFLTTTLHRLVSLLPRLQPSWLTGTQISLLIRAPRQRRS